LAVATTINSVFGAELDEGVLVLTDANFDDELAKHEHLLVEFYAPWCGHCKKLAPEYSAAAEVLAKNDPPLSLAKVDATVETKLAEKFAVQGFPTLLFFNNGNKVDYTGGRTKDAIIEWVVKKSGPPSLEATCEVLKTKVESSKFILAYFGAIDETLYVDAHIPLATENDKITFVNVADEACAKEFGASYPGEVFFRKFEENTVVYSGEPTKDALNTFVKPLMVPTVFEFSEEQVEPIFGQQQPLVVLFRSGADGEAEFMKTFDEAAKANKGKMLFSYSDVQGGIQEKLAEFMGVKSEHLPILKAILPADMKKFDCDTKPADLTVDVISKFVADVLSGSIKPSLKSDPIPESNDGPVTVIVGEQFEEIVMDKTKDVLVKYYAPWCGHCKKLAPIWDELGEAFKDNKDLVIAKFDATTNEADGVNIRGYPTLKFYPKDNKEGVDYSGERDFESLKTYLTENASTAKSAGAHDEL